MRAPLASVPRVATMTTVLAHLALASAACGNGCPDENDLLPPLPIDVTVVDAVTGAVLCDAQLALTAPCSGCFDEPPFVRYLAADASCGGYQVIVAVPGAVTISVAASGYAPKSVTVYASSPRCGPPPITTATVRLSRACETLTSHDDGLGDTWSDCAAAHTYSEAEATAACSAYDATPACTQSMTCPPGNGTATGVAVCGPPPASSGVTGCACWTFQGAGAGHVRVSSADCECASDSDPSWF